MENESGKKFASPQAELAHWRDLAQKLKTELEDVKEEAEEYRISSTELEAELETQLEDLETKNKDLVNSSAKMKTENDLLREKINEMQTLTHRELSEMEVTLAQVQAYNMELQRYIRELEQSNDDLERSNRATVASLEEFELRLNTAVERNAFLEGELDEKETLTETVQRLKDEARDLRQELNVKSRNRTSESFDNNENINNSNTPSSSVRVKPVQVVTAVTDPHKLLRKDSGSTKTDSYVIRNESMKSDISQGATPLATTPLATPLSRLNNSTFFTPPSVGTPVSGFHTPMAPSARISALNIVGDLLRKVGALETKLASCRNMNKDAATFGRQMSDPPLNSPRTRRRHLNRGASLPQGTGSKITA